MRRTTLPLCQTAVRVCRRREPVIIDDDEDYSLSHHQYHHHHHHQLPAAYLQLAGKISSSHDSPSRSPSEGHTLPDVETTTPGCAYCTVGVGAVDGPTSSAEDGAAPSAALCGRCGHHHHGVHAALNHHRNSSDYVTGVQHLHHCHHQQQQLDAI